MRFNVILLVIVLLLLGVLTFINRPSFGSPHTLNLGFVVLERVPLGLILAVTAAVLSMLFVALGALTNLRRKAEQNQIFRQLEQMRVQLDSQESARFQDLAARLDKLTGMVGSGAVSSGRGSSGPVTVDLTSVLERIDRVRDELAADIAYSEDALLRELRGQDAEGGPRPGGGTGAAPSSGPSPLIRKRGL